MMDTVFDQTMRVVFSDEPSVVRRRLKASHPDTWVKVCIGESGKVVDIPEYLYAEKYQTVQQMIRDVMKKQSFTLYQRHPDKLNKEIERAARKIIELIEKKQGE